MKSYNELLDQAIESAFEKLPKNKQDNLLYIARRLNNNRTKPLSDKAKIEILGKVGVWLTEKNGRIEPQPFMIAQKKDRYENVGNLFWGAGEWVDFDHADRYTIREKSVMELPKDGTWILDREEE